MVSPKPYLLPYQLVLYLHGTCQPNLCLQWLRSLHTRISTSFLVVAPAACVAGVYTSQTDDPSQLGATGVITAIDLP
jgi:hypothetical protein